MCAYKSISSGILIHACAFVVVKVRGKISQHQLAGDRNNQPKLRNRFQHIIRQLIPLESQIKAKRE